MRCSHVFRAISLPADIKIPWINPNAEGDTFIFIFRLTADCFKMR